MRIGHLSLKLFPHPAPTPSSSNTPALPVNTIQFSSNIPSSVTQNLTPNCQQQSWFCVDRILMQYCIFLSKEEKEKNPMHIV